MTQVTAEQAEAGQAVYTKQTLAVYDFVVLGISNRFLWKCPTRRLEEHYNKHVTANHLDVGVGTGYFLDRCRFPSPTPRIALMDLNTDSLEFASQRMNLNVKAPYILTQRLFEALAARKGSVIIFRQIIIPEFPQVLTRPPRWLTEPWHHPLSWLEPSRW